MSTGQIEQAVRSLFDMEFTWYRPTAPLMERTAVIARTSEVTVYDAAFVALAEAIQADFITADERLTRRLDTLPFVLFLGDVEADEMLPEAEDTDADESTRS